MTTRSSRVPRPSAHPRLTKSYAIDQIDDIEHLRAVAHRMWEAFFAAHSQASHAIAVLGGYEDCAACLAYLRDDGPPRVCDQWHAWQQKINDGFGSL